ncbi:CHRD domain-containing protein [Pirellulales bacterium]|nr:CHRD domain-containing protein [Pirellulales bacterium]
MKTSLKSLFLAVAAVVVLNCQTAFGIAYTLSGPMDVFQAESNGGFGGGTGSGSGTIAGDYDDVTKLLNYTLTWADLSSEISNAHFHRAASGVSGPPDLQIPAPWTSPYVGSATLDASQEGNLLAGNWYANIHTDNFSSGEIRGQVEVSPIPEPTTLGMAAMTCLAVVRLRRRQR